MIRAKKSLGQNFLTDSRITHRIIDAVAPLPSDVIIEIGPGTGALTGLLVEGAGFVVAAEIDKRLIESLQTSLAAENFSLIEADALTVDWDDLLKTATRLWRARSAESELVPRVRIVANLPYYIATPIIEGLLALGGRLFDMTLMLQDEVADRIVSDPGSRDYGYLSVLVQYHSVARKLFEVPPHAFTPAPKVHSAVAHLLVRQQPPISVADKDRFFAMVRAAFAQRRKTILNNLKAFAAVAGFSTLPGQALESAGVDPKRRAETLSIAEFGRLYDVLFLESKS